MPNDPSETPVNYGGTKHYNEEDGVSYEDEIVNPDYYTEHPDEDLYSDGPVFPEGTEKAIEAAVAAFGGVWGAIALFLYEQFVKEDESHS